MRVRLFVLSAVLCCAQVLMAQNALPQDTVADTRWSVSCQIGGALAFGDDSWDVLKDFKDANGSAVSLSVGYEFSPLLSGRLKARYLKLYNRINLEVYDAYRDIYPTLLPRKGFYGYKAFALQAEAMFNLANLVPRESRWFNMYVIGGIGVNTMSGYDKNVDNWDGSYDGLVYHVDMRTHTMPAGILGGMLDFRVCPEISFNIEASATFTGDNMEGVVYEEPYDVYITYSFGATLHF